MSQATDLRSDTVTQPSAAMLQAMTSAELGDDVLGDDPTVARLEAESARLLGKEAALFVPTGTMANQVCVRSHTQPGDEIIVEGTAHIYVYEGGGYAAISGVSIANPKGERGQLDAEQVRAAIRPPGGLSHFPPTRLVCVENSANSGGGSVYPLKALDEIAAVAREHQLSLHLDGARMFNAAVALGCEPAEMARPFDSIAFCLSKGLGCPVGSVIAGSRAFIERAHRFRKMFGGGMRQAGLLAAAGLYALEHNVARLADDHSRARRLGEAIARLPGVTVDLDSVETNMVYADIAGTGKPRDRFVSELEAAGARVIGVGPTRVRAVTHLDVDDAGIDRAIAAFTAVCAR